jgi:hypothetical protein
MQVNEKQVGGTHYSSSYQHWDFVEDNGIGYLEACATKYITRHHKKNGLQDLEKAEHYVEKLISLAADGRRPRNKNIDDALIQKFTQANQIGDTEAEICRLLFKGWETEDLHTALFLIRELVDKYKEPRIDNTGMQQPFGFTEKDS